MLYNKLRSSQLILNLGYAFFFSSSNFISLDLKILNILKFCEFI